MTGLDLGRAKRQKHLVTLVDSIVMFSSPHLPPLWEVKPARWAGSSPTKISHMQFSPLVSFLFVHISLWRTVTVSREGSTMLPDFSTLYIAVSTFCIAVSTCHESLLVNLLFNCFYELGLSFNLKGFFVRSWLFCVQHPPCSILFQCMLGGSVEV